MNVYFILELVVLNNIKNKFSKLFIKKSNSFICFLVILIKIFFYMTSILDSYISRL